MINYTEKGAGLHEAVRKAGYSLREENGVWVSDNDSAVQAIIDAYDPIPLVKIAKWEEIKAERDRRQFLPITVNGKQFHSDQNSRIQQIGLVMMGANIPANLQWKTMDDTFVTMTQALAGQIFSVTATHDQAVFAAAETHRAAMLQSSDPASYDFSSGWPA